MGKATTWTDDRLKIVHTRYVLGGEPAAIVAADLGVTPEALRRRVADEPTWKRDKRFEKRNQANANRARAGRPPVLELTPEQPWVGLPGPMLALQNAPVKWSKAVEDSRPLEERILSALRERPLSVMALASVIGAKEYAVDVQLAALAHAGGVEASPAAECGRRNRLWRAAA